MPSHIQQTIPENENRVIIPPILWFFGDSESTPYYGAGLEDFDCVRIKLLFFRRLKIILLWETFPKCIPNGKWGFGGEKKWWGRDGATATVCAFFAPFRRVNIPPYYPHIINAKKITFDERKVLPFLPFPLFSFFRPLYSFAPFLFPSVLLILFLLIFCPFPRSLFPHFKTFSKTFFRAYI